MRYWAVIGQPYAKTTRGTDLLLQRFEELGFNACRLWDTAPNQENYTPGDGSPTDCLDYFVAQAGRRGFKLWCAGLNDVGELRNNVARIWNPVLETKALERMRAVATHQNKHNGLRWCDDPTFVVWELSNEEWWVRRMLGGQWQTLAIPLKNELLTLWNTWLQKRYRTDSALKSAWSGLLPGESLTKQSVLFAPMAGATSSFLALNDANPEAKKALEGLKQAYQRQDFPEARGRDVLAFLLELQLAHKKREAKAVKSWGKSCRLCPLIYDTGIGYEIQSQYLHQSADAVAHDAYVNGTGPEYKPNPSSPLAQLDAERISANAGPWVNWLLKPPGISQGVPWLEHNRVAGKPYFAYETQIQQPAKYRADFPLRIAALAAIQDWDFVCWHYFSAGEAVSTESRPFDKPMDITTGGHPQGYHFTYDEVQSAMMRAAGQMFVQFTHKPAPRPTTFIFGRKSLTDPASMVYAGSYGPRGMDMLQTTYQYGLRLKIDPQREDDQVIGPVIPFEARNTHNPYTPTEQLVFDWKRGFLSMDAPAGVAWTGLLARYGTEVRFKNGVRLSHVTLHNPEGIYEPITDDEKYVAFALYSHDGKPLSQCTRASLSLVSTSFNSGFQLEKEGQHTVAGALPVLVVRGGATVEAPALTGMRYVLRDWHLSELGRGTVQKGTLVVPSHLPVFVIELER